MPEIKQILGLYLIGEPPQEEDRLRNTDLIVLHMEAVRIAVRVRKHSFLKTHPNEFTVRLGRPNGHKPELTKILEGWGRYFFYGFSDADEFKLAQWTLADLNAFRVGFQRLLIKDAGRIPGELRSNRDGSGDFRAFRWLDFPDIIVASFDAETFTAIGRTSVQSEMERRQSSLFDENQ